jgi:hypothetical protein
MFSSLLHETLKTSWKTLEIIPRNVKRKKNKGWKWLSQFMQQIFQHFLFKFSSFDCGMERRDYFPYIHARLLPKGEKFSPLLNLPWSECTHIYTHSISGGITIKFSPLVVIVIFFTLHMTMVIKLYQAMYTL